MSEPAVRRDVAPTDELYPGEASESALVGLGDRLTHLAAHLDRMDHETRHLKDVDDFDALLVLLHRVSEQAAVLKRIQGSVQDRAWAVRGEVYGDHHHPDLGVVSVRRTANRPRWDHETTAERVVQQHVEAAGGEVPGDPAVVVGWLLEAGALSYWRKGVLKSLGIDVKGEDLFWSEPGSPTITFPSMSGK